MVATLDCPALGGPVRLGHIERTPDSRDFMYEKDVRPVLKKAGLLPRLPQNWGHGNDERVYPMSANGPDPTAPGLAGTQGCGDCEIAGKNNEFITANLNAGKPAPPLDGSTAVPVYSLLSAQVNGGQGYNPQDGSNDTGLDTRTVLTYAQKIGFTDKAGVGHKAGPYIFGEAGNIQTYWEMAYLFEAAGIAWDFTQQMMDQFNAGKPFDWVARSTSEGGHYTAGWGPNHCGCWTRNQGFTTACYMRQSTEVSAFITADRYKAVTGLDAEGYADIDLEKFAIQLATGGVVPAPKRRWGPNA